MKNRKSLKWVLFLLLAAVAGCAAPTPEPPPTLAVVERASGFEELAAITTARDGRGDLYVVERAGRIWRLSPDLSERHLYLDIQARVSSENSIEQGLEGLAFAPDFAASRRFFV